jgi:two-component system sensor histidine kinase CiaH
MNQQAVLSFLRSTTARLAVSYLAIIMVLSIGFSIVFYYTSAQELGRQLPPPSLLTGGVDINPVPGYGQFFQARIDEGRHALLIRLMLLNGLACIGGALLSYYLARRTLRPIEDAMEAQSRFVTDASHELRTPLTAVLASNEVALRKPSLTLADTKGIIKSNMEEMAKLKGLSDGLLGLAKQDKPARVGPPVSLQDIAGDGMNHILKAAQAKQIAVEDSVPNVRVRGDRQSLTQAVVILLDNAIKYSPPSSTIQLEGYQKDRHGYISVRDEGSGISPIDLPHIFDRFYRADASRARSESNGYGIGLSIAKKIAEQYHGKIIASSTLDRGSTFTLELPLA